MSDKIESFQENINVHDKQLETYEKISDNVATEHERKIDLLKRIKDKVGDQSDKDRIEQAINDTMVYSEAKMTELESEADAIENSIKETSREITDEHSKVTDSANELIKESLKSEVGREALNKAIDGLQATEIKLGGMNSEIRSIIAKKKESFQENRARIRRR